MTEEEVVKVGETEEKAIIPAPEPEREEAPREMPPAMEPEGLELPPEEPVKKPQIQISPELIAMGLQAVIKLAEGGSGGSDHIIVQMALNNFAEDLAYMRRLKRREYGILTDSEKQFVKKVSGQDEE